MRTLALPAMFLLLSSAFAFTQTTVNVTLNVPAYISGATCGVIAQETIDGAPYDLTPWQGMSMEVCPNYYFNSSNYGYIFINLPPQPFAPGLGWYQLLPSPYAGQITRGLPQPVNGKPGYFVETDTFSYTVSYYYFTQQLQAWTGTLVRQMQQHKKCFRGCSFYFTELSDTVAMTGMLD